MRYFHYLYIAISLLFAACNSTQQTGDNTFQHSIDDSLSLGNVTALTHDNEQYHLFYHCTSNKQNKYWGHATSDNLQQWTQMPLLDLNENGSVIYDTYQSLPVETEQAALVILSTDTTLDNAIALQYSNDNGATWHAYAHNPIVVNKQSYSIEDIKVFRHDETQNWVMLTLSNNEIKFYISTNLTQWEYVSEYEHDWTSPKGEWSNINFTTVDNPTTNERKWSLFISSDQGAPNGEEGCRYIFGDFDGYTFKADRSKLQWLDTGTDTYIGVSTKVHTVDGTSTVMLTSNNSVHTALALPKRLSWTTKDNKNLMVFSPIDFQRTFTKKTNETIEVVGESKIGMNLDLPLDIKMSFEMNNRKYLDFAEVYGLTFTNEQGAKLVVAYHNMRRYFFISYQSEIANYSKLYYAPYIINADEMKLNVILSEYAVELIVDDGLVTMNLDLNPDDTFNAISLFAEEGKVLVNDFTIRK